MRRKNTFWQVSSEVIDPDTLCNFIWNVEKIWCSTCHSAPKVLLKHDDKLWCYHANCLARVK